MPRSWAADAGRGLGYVLAVACRHLFRTDFAGRSMGFAAEIPDYRDTPAGKLRENFHTQDGRQPNDPDLAAAAIIRVVNDDAAPLRLPLGPEAVDRIRTKLRGQLADLERWEPVSVDTRYRDTSEG